MNLAKKAVAQSDLGGQVTKFDSALRRPETSWDAAIGYNVYLDAAAIQVGMPGKTRTDSKSKLTSSGLIECSPQCNFIEYIVPRCRDTANLLTSLLTFFLRVVLRLLALGRA